MSGQASHESTGDRQVRIYVHPEPDEEAIAVIVAAVRHRLRVQDDDLGDLDQEKAQRPSRWVMAGRREAMAGPRDDRNV